MKQIINHYFSIFFLFFSSFFFNYCSQNQVVVSKNISPDGKILKIESNDEFKIELHKSYYENGNLEYEVEVRNGIPDGISRYWDENSHLVNITYYENGKLHGLSISYFPNGIISSKVKYFYGQNHGINETYHSNGKIKSNQIFEFDKPISELLRFDENGNLIYQP